VGQLLVVLFLIAFKLAPPELIPDPLWSRLDYVEKK